MSRVIKFRAWDAKLNKWFVPVYRAYAGELLDMHITLSGQPCIRSLEDCSDMREIDRYVLSQFTGLHDKNGVEIYEGDVVKGKPYFDEEERVSYIIYQKNGFWVNGEHFGWEGEGLWEWDKIEVIGNIHEHSELLK